MGSNEPIPLSKTHDVLVPIEMSRQTAQWSTLNLGLRLGADATCATVASVLVAPIICIIDKSIVQKASSGQSITSSLRSSLGTAMAAPHRFLTSKPFLLIFGLYFSTYTTANTIDTLASTFKSKPASTVEPSTPKFVATSAVNMSLCVYKDSQFAKMFAAPSASSGPATSIPKLSYALFAARDSLTIFASFNLPSIIASRLQHLPEVVRQKLPEILRTESGRQNTAQFVAPAAMQVFSTPIHLLGLDFYNRQQALGFGERVARVTRDWGASTLARMGRIVPAFGVGGVVNGSLRRKMMDNIDVS